MPVKVISPLSRFGLSESPKMQKSRVCRNLFGSPNHAEVRKDLDEQLRSTNTHIKDIWNFDAELDQPLQGRFEWTLVSDKDYVPDFYRRPCRPSKARSFRQRLAELPTADVKTCLTPPSSPECLLPVISQDIDSASLEELRRENETTPEARVVRQSKINDHFKSKKRLHSDVDSDEDDRPSAKSAKH